MDYIVIQMRKTNREKAIVWDIGEACIFPGVSTTSTEEEHNGARFSKTPEILLPFRLL